MSEIAEKFGIDLETEHRCQCPRCASKGGDNSKDNLMVYGLDKEGRHKGAYCWSCHFTIPSQEWLDENGEQEKEWELVGSVFNDEVKEKLKSITTTNSGGWRGIRADTTQYFGVLHEYDTQTGVLVKQYYPTLINNQLSGYKCRELPKKFSAIGETGKECELFGQFRFKGSNAKSVLVVGGEVDQLSAFQMLDDYAKGRLKQGEERYDRQPVVSSTIGEAGTVKQLQANYEFLNQFDKIILCLDNDAAGKEAMDAIAKVLPKGKVFEMRMNLKDPNEYLKQGRSREFISAFYSAKPYSPSGIVGSSSLMEAIRAAATVPKIPLPAFMHKLQKLMAGGIPLGKIVNLGSASGTGKTTFSEELVYFWIFNSPHRIGIVSLEAEKGEYGNNILSRHLGQKLNLIEEMQDKLDLLDSEYVLEQAKILFENDDGSDRFHLVDDRDGGLNDLKDQIMKLIIQCDCKVIILDPLQDALAGLDNDQQELFMAWEKGLTKSHGVTFININHIRKSGTGQKANSQGADITEEDFQGTSAIFKSGACNLLFTRNKEAEDAMERNTTFLKMTKCRWTGQTSPVAGKYYYDNPTHTLYDYDDFLYQYQQQGGQF